MNLQFHGLPRHGPHLYCSWQRRIWKMLFRMWCQGVHVNDWTLFHISSIRILILDEFPLWAFCLDIHMKNKGPSTKHLTWKKLTWEHLISMKWWLGKYYFWPYLLKTCIPSHVIKAWYASHPLRKRRLQPAFGFDFHVNSVHFSHDFSTWNSGSHCLEHLLAWHEIQVKVHETKPQFPLVHFRAWQILKNLKETSFCIDSCINMN